MQAPRHRRTAPAGSRRSTEARPRRRTPAGPAWLAALALLAGCASGSKQATLPSDGPTMAEVYRRHQAQPPACPALPPLPPLADTRGRTAVDAGTPLEAERDALVHRFARLPNPDFVLYVTPHLAGAQRHPVPGYATLFPLYPRIEYALPGELPPGATRAGRRE